MTNQLQNMQEIALQRLLAFNGHVISGGHLGLGKCKNSVRIICPTCGHVDAVDYAAMKLALRFQTPAAYKIIIICKEGECDHTLLRSTVGKSW